MNRRDRLSRGAVYVEFLIALLPLLVFFLSLCQLAYVEAASIVVKHAAVMATRAAIVVLPDDGSFYGGEEVNLATGKRLQDIRRAAAVPLRAIQRFPRFEIELPAGERVDPDSMVQVRVDMAYRCEVPIGNLVVCGGRQKTLSGISALPNQGAHYEY